MGRIALGVDQKYRADIQGLMAIAVVLVLLFHFGGIVEGGYLGVDMFFVISGFVIAQSTHREISDSGSFDWRSFLRRRVRRLLPGAAVVLLFTAFASLILLSPFGPQQETARMIVGAATYSTNFLLMPTGYFSIDSASNPLLHFWSLAVEEQFYLVWPIAAVAFVALMKKVNRDTFRLIVFLALIGVLLFSATTYYLLLEHTSSVAQLSLFSSLQNFEVSLENFAFYSPVTRSWEFIAGVISFLIFRKIKIRANDFWSYFSWVVGATSVLFAVFSVAQLSLPTDNLGATSHALPTFMCVLGTSSLLIFGGQISLARLGLGNVVMLKLGDWSYSMYLWHWPIWAFIGRLWGQSGYLALVTTVLTVLSGWAQHSLFENPIRLNRMWKRIPSLGLVASMVTASVVLVAIHAWLTPNIAMHIAGRTLGESALHVIEKPCEGELISVGNAKSCIYSNPDSGETAMLVGDSMAKSLSEGFVLAAGNLGMKSMIFSMPGCPFLIKDSPVVSNEVCSPWRANVANAINVVKPDILVISNLGSLYIDILGQTYSREEAKQIWSNEMARTISQSVSQLKAVLIVQPPPRFVQDVKYDISLLRTISKRELRPDVIARRIVANEIERNLLDPAKANLGLLNFDDVFCNESDCSQVIGNQLMFEDADHLSPQGSRLLVDQIETKMKEVLGR